MAIPTRVARTKDRLVDAPNSSLAYPNGHVDMGLGGGAALAF